MNIFDKLAHKMNRKREMFFLFEISKRHKIYGG